MGQQRRRFQCWRSRRLFESLRKRNRFAPTVSGEGRNCASERLVRPDERRTRKLRPHLGRFGGSMTTESATTPSLIEQSIEILRHSRDGENLDPAHLSLVEAAVNNNLTECGVQAFHQLHADVVSAKYIKPWLCGVEHVTRDLQGYVYWKGNRIEHFTYSAMDAAQLKAITRRLAEKCRHIEALGLPVCGSTYPHSRLDERPVE